MYIVIHFLHSIFWKAHHAKTANKDEDENNDNDGEDRGQAKWAAGSLMVTAHKRYKITEVLCHYSECTREIPGGNVNNTHKNCQDSHVQGTYPP